MPAAHIPWQGLVGSNIPVRQFAYPRMNADLTAVTACAASVAAGYIGMSADILTIGMLHIPVIIAGVYTEQPIVRADIPPEIGIVGARAMYYNTLDRHCFARFIAGVVL
jgi:hypothetical protein